jgi:hypothetical protein
MSLAHFYSTTGRPNGFTERYEYALETLTDLPYAQWREFDPEE